MSVLYLCTVTDYFVVSQYYVVLVPFDLTISMKGPEVVSDLTVVVPCILTNHLYSKTHLFLARHNCI